MKRLPSLRKLAIPAAILALFAAIAGGSAAASSPVVSPSDPSTWPWPPPDQPAPPASVWVTKAALNKPDLVAGRLAELGFARGNIMLNDFHKARAPQSFATHDAGRVIALASALRRAGLDVDLTTWAMPHPQFIDGMASLRQLRDATGAQRIWLDAEEPWNRARGEINYDAAAAHVGDVLSGIPLALSAISYANQSKLRGLAKICEVWSPQAYSNKRPGSMDPATAAQSSVDRWRARFGQPSRGFVMGLAAYEQPGDPLAMAAMMDQALEGARAAGVLGVCYWAHGAILSSPAVAAFLRSRLHA